MKKGSIYTYAQQLRRRMTDAEVKLWEKLRNKQLHGFKFRRQHPLLETYIVDFYCAQVKLVIEIDGPVHVLPLVKLYDQNRENELKSYGFRIMRFSNKEIETDIHHVLSKIAERVYSIKQSISME